MIAQSLLEQRFNLRRTQYLCERFEKSPNITEECFITNHLSICYSDSDVSIIPELCGLFLRMYLFTKNWFDYRGDMAMQLWVAPALDDLKFMTCMPCAEGYACAPGTRNGTYIILIDSPLLCGKNSDKDRLSAVLAHEICHHFVTDISHATLFTMKRKENRDVPMWLEEGLGSVMMAEVSPSFRTRFDERIAGTTQWYSLEDMWNDLSDCENPDRAYLQAYRETGNLIKQKGRNEIIRLLYLNRTHCINWNGLPSGGEAMAKARYANDRN